jgi:hypothetical protein
MGQFGLFGICATCSPPSFCPYIGLDHWKWKETQIFCLKIQVERHDLEKLHHMFA